MQHPVPRIQAPLARFTLRVLSLWVLLCGGASAHQAQQSYVFLDVAAEQTTGIIELPLSDLEEALGRSHPVFIDAAPGEVNTDALFSYLQSHLKIAADGIPAELTLTGIDTREIEIARFAVVAFALDPAPQQPQQFSIRYDAILHALPEHRGGLVIENNYVTGMTGNHARLSTWFAPGREQFELPLKGRTLAQRIWTFIVLGVEHIWIGIDHVLFIVTLLLTSVVTRHEKRWVPTADLRTAAMSVVAIVTLFTIAHSITLALALKGWISLPSRFVESVIALTVLAVAVDNLKPLFGRWKWTLIFAFGLFHGLGFASVLADLTLQVESKAVALVGFNIGVELGQLAIVAVLFPLLFLLRNFQYAALILKPGSLLIVLIASWWLVSRALDIASPAWLPI